MSDITWQEPPPQNKRGGAPSYKDFFDALRSRPGDWALFPGSPCSQQTRSNIKNGVYSGTDAGEYDATSRTRDDGKCDIYVRYIGDGGGS